MISDQILHTCISEPQKIAALDRNAMDEEDQATASGVHEK